MTDVFEETDELPPLTADDQRYADETQKAEGKRYHRERTEHSRWFSIAVLAVLGLLATMVYDHVDKRSTTVPYVVTLRVTTDGDVTIVEPPVPLKEYVVPASAIQFMIGRFIKDRQRLGTDKVEMHDREMTVAAQVCGPAAQQIMLPPTRQAALVSVNMTTPPRPTASPQTYKVSWSEHWTGADGRYLGEHHLEADVTVEQRVIDWTKPEAMAIFTRQPMGLCVSSFVIHETPRLR